MKGGFDERFTGYFNADVGRWAVKLRDLEYRMRRLTMPYPRPYEAGPIHVLAFEQTARWLG